MGKFPMQLKTLKNAYKMHKFAPQAAKFLTFLAPQAAKFLTFGNFPSNSAAGGEISIFIGKFPFGFTRKVPKLGKFHSDFPQKLSWRKLIPMESSPPGQLYRALKA